MILLPSFRQIKHLRYFFVLFSCLGITGLSHAQETSHPKAHKENHLDTFFTKVVWDEYRWLEDYERDDLKKWLAEQRKHTEKTLQKAASKHQSFMAINKYAYVNYHNPQKMGDYYFTKAFYNNYSAPALFVQNSFRDDPSILVDPATISTKDNIYIEKYAVSKDNQYLAYQFSRNGSDWGEIKVIRINTARHKKDHLKNSKFSSIAWKDDGFYYSKFPQENLGKTLGQEVYYHQLGTDQSEDQLIFRRKNNPSLFFKVFTTSDERFLIIKEFDEEQNTFSIFYLDFEAAIPGLRPLYSKLSTNDYVKILDSHKEHLIGISRKEKSNGTIVKIDPKEPLKWKVLVAEFEDAYLKEVKLLEDKIIGVFQANHRQQIVFFDYTGKVLKALEIPIGFSVRGFSGEKNDRKLLFSYEGYTQPKTVYILDTEMFRIKPLQATTVNFDYRLYDSKEIEITSFDSTKMSLLMVYKKGSDLKESKPTLLKAYGGFGIIERPHFQPGIVHFLNQGGTFFFAYIRGGGEKGRSWMAQGRGIKKQNSFKDFIAAAEFLIEEGYTSAEQLAITGTSNGGLVVGVALTKRPELFKAAVPIVAPFDMLRFEQFTIGHLHSDEYGSVNDAIGFQNLYEYSPLHNIKEEVNYPATLIMTASEDDRVPALHAYKFTAKLQNRKAQVAPILLRVEEGAGHSGATSSLKNILREEADLYNFILYQLKESQ